MATRPSTAAEDVQRRYPHFRSSFSERRLLFEREPAQSTLIQKPAPATLPPELKAAGA